MSARSLIFASGAAALGVVGGLLLAEAGLRAFSLAPADGIFTVNEAEFQRIPGLFGPGQDIVDRQLPALPHRVRIDSLGYRGPDFPRQKVAGELRIFSIGDSFTFGDFVDDEETVPAVLARRLSDACGRPVRVINGGVGGSTISTHLQMLRRGWVTAPDIVVLTFSENDVDDLRADMWSELAANRAAKSRFPLSWVYPVLRRTALWNFALEMRGRLQASTRPSASSDGTDSALGADVEALRAEYARLLEELSEEVAARERRLVMSAFPSHWTVADSSREEQLRWVAGIAAQRSLPFVNLLHPLRATSMPTDSLYLLPHDGHASPLGNEIAGTAIADSIHALGLCGSDLTEGQ